jgi:hypothetical protein
LREVIGSQEMHGFLAIFSFSAVAEFDEIV